MILTEKAVQNKVLFYVTKYYTVKPMEYGVEEK
jgi:hypothetical protein